MSKILNLIPYFGKYTAETSKQVTTSGGNFVWHAMAAYQWFHQDEGDIEKTIKDLQSILDSKKNIKAILCNKIDQFDWSHMYSDDSRPTKVQKDRNKEFNEAIALCPLNIQTAVYQYFIFQYMKCAPHPTNPISLEQFLKGVDV